VDRLAVAWQIVAQLHAYGIVFILCGRDTFYDQVM